MKLLQVVGENEVSLACLLFVERMEGRGVENADLRLPRRVTDSLETSTSRGDRNGAVILTVTLSSLRSHTRSIRARTQARIPCLQDPLPVLVERLSR